MSMGHATIWVIIVVLGLGTFLIRFSFLGLIGSRPIPAWALRLLRYTPMAILPGIVAPLVLSPAATDGQFDPARGTAALVALLVGVVTRNTLAAILLGGATLYMMLWLAG